MKVKEVCQKINLGLLAGGEGLEREITGLYICDLLSWVMSHAVKGNAWITVQTHSNIIAVATLLDMSCIIIPEDMEVEEETLKKANEEKMPLLRSSQNSYDLVKEFLNHGIGK